MTTAHSVHSVLRRLGAAGVRLRVDGDGKLSAHAAPGVLDATLRELIAAHKAALVALLGDQGPQAPLAPRDPALPVPASYGQQGLWLAECLADGGAAYNMPCALRIRGSALRLALLEQAFGAVIRRHEALRTVFEMQGELLVQHVIPDPAQVFSVTDLSAHPQSARAALAAQLAGVEAAKPFDLRRGPLLRARLLRLAADEHVLLVCTHHIVSDAWSLGVLVQELLTGYLAAQEGRAAALPALHVQYGDYAAWQRQALQGTRLQTLLAYWKHALADAPALLALPTTRPRPARQRHQGASCPLVLPPSTAAALGALARAHGATLFMALAATFSVLLYRYSGQDDICLATPVAGRDRPELEPLIGYFVNTLVLRVRVNGGAPFGALLAAVRETALQAFAHQDMPFDRLVAELRPERSASHAPLCQVMFVLQNAPQPQPDLPGLRFEPVPIAGQGAKFDLTCSMTAAADGSLQGSLQYDTALFDAPAIARMARHFAVLAEAVCAQPDVPVGRLPLLEPIELATLTRFNDTAMPWPRDALLHHAFEAQAAAHPEHTALVWRSTILTYGELNRRANRIAHRLLALGVRPDERVAVCTERTPDMVAALLGILKAGAAYVPLDPAYPAERLAFMLADCVPVAVLCEVATAARVPAGAAPMVVLDADSLLREQPAHDPRPHGVQPSHLAYVIYTSGSTGQPKGVMIEHRNAVAFIAWAQASFTPDQLELTLCATSINFDLAVYELFLPLSSGRPLALVQNVLCGDDELSEVTLINTVPSALDALLKAGRVPGTAKLVNLAGEPLGRHLVEQLFAETAVQTVGNLYGPSETTTYSTWVLMARADGFVPHIGRPIGNTQVHILDAQRLPVPVGVTGELYIGGAGVARGYLHRPELTAERFIADPFSNDRQARMYRTGDLGHWREDGNIEYLGRNDFQVKIRGFRIELGEIEATLAACAGVDAAAAAVREDVPGERRIVGYFVARDALPVAALRARLAAVLPDYMVPVALVRLAALPLTANGKLDRMALPAPDSGHRAQACYAAPRPGLERLLADLWQQVLGLPRVGRDDHFFEIGGDSLLAVQMLARLYRQTGSELPPRALFAHPTLAAFAAAAAAGGPAGCLVTLRAEGDGPPLFLVHGGRGEIGYARSLLAHIDPRFPVHALAASGFLDGEAASCSVPEMARHYLDAMRRVQAHGPLHIAGWSAGGTIAYEIACQLEAAGERPGFVGLLDTSAVYRDFDTGAGAPPDLLAAQVAALMVWLPAALPDGLPGALALLRAERDLDGMLAVCQRAGLLAAGIDVPAMRRQLAVWYGIDVALRQYRPARSLSLPPHVFVASDEARADPALGWERCQTPSPVVLPVPGGHYSMLEAAHVHHLGEALSTILRRCR